MSQFDVIYDRSGTGAIKYMKHPQYPQQENIIPMWVADMDFQTAPEIINALKSTAEHGIFGYTALDDEYYNAVIAWLQRRFDYTIKREWISSVNCVLFAVSAAIRALTEENDSILIFQPVYFPFPKVITNNRRKVIVSELVYDGRRYVIDYADFERKIACENVKAVLLCSPHNPVGRVWDKEELKRIADICIQHQVYIISDEIHSDLVYQKHTMIASLSDETAALTVTCTAPTKTFNLAGIQGANIIIPNREIKNKFDKELSAAFADGLSITAIAAIKAAYQHGEPWLEALLTYLQKNIDYLAKRLENTKIKLIKPEGTYLMWLDCRALGLTDTELERFFIERCGVWMNSGYTFGKGGSGFMRMNIACPRETLAKAIDRIIKAVESRQQ